VTRPTSDLIKGVIFSMLEAEAYKRGFEPDEEGALAAALAWPHVLDLFAGSGALGIEALSRGALHVDFVDEHVDAARTIHANLVSAQLRDRSTVHRQPVALALRRLTGPFDAVFADPPYADASEVAHLVEALDAAAPVHPNSVIVLEHAATTDPPATLAGLELASSRRHGGTQITVYGGRARNAAARDAGC
jgi:16S rRNA (guanine966-N2)-methyltransferase